MTYGPVQLPSFMSNDADFRAFGQGISAGLAAIGLVQTTDTGQINWATATRPAATNTAAGYEIWRFADALQATLPVFIKIEYGTFTTVDRPGLWITVGTSTNGAGTITGQAGGRGSFGPGGSKVAGGTLPTYISGGPNSLYAFTNIDAGSQIYGSAFSVERLLDGDGNDTADGICWFARGNASATQLQVIPASGAVPGVAGSFPAVNPATFARSTQGTDIVLMPVLLPVGKVYLSRWLVQNPTDIAALLPIAATRFGVTKHYIACGVGVSTVNTNEAPVLPWD